MKTRIFLVAIIILALSSCSLFKTGGENNPAAQAGVSTTPESTPYKTGGVYKPATAYDKVSAPVTASQESTVELSDGAQIIIPENSLSGDATVTIERNAQKTSSLPPLGDKDLPLSDFYNFQIEGGQLTGPVDLVIPFDASKLPEHDGILVAMIPTGQGWQYVPVEPYGDKVLLYTTEPGDPLIAWHFVCIPGKIYLPSDPYCKEQQEKLEEKAICSPDIALSVIPETGTLETKYEFFGQLVPAKTRYLGVISRKPAGNVPVEIVINVGENDIGITRNLVTDPNGKFNFTLDASDSTSGLSVGENLVKAIAYCDRWFGEIAVKSYGSVAFKISQEGVTLPPAAPPASQSQPITPPQSPTDKIAVPNVVGITFEDAQATLEKLGFNTTWIDGKSKLELGKIYLQAPLAGTLSVPHRTTVVIYRTTEVITEPPECAQFNLTPEECANAGSHQYLETCTITDNHGEMKCGCGFEGNTRTIPFGLYFTGDGIIELGPKAIYRRIASNKYVVEFNTSWKTHIELTITETGLLFVRDEGDSVNGCQVINEMKIIKYLKFARNSGE